MKINKDKKYYVYGYIRLDNNSYFYIGKGCGRRIYETKFSRNDHFVKIIKNKSVCVELNIIFDSISLANEYFKRYGYSRLKISECCNGKRSYSGKLKDGTKIHWQYYTPATTEYENSSDREATV